MPRRLAGRCGRSLRAAAREHFSLFQLAAGPDDLPEGFSDRRGGRFGCQRLLRARNWLELELSPGDGLTATWHSERPEGPDAPRLSIAPTNDRH